MKKSLILCVVTFLILMGILLYAEFGASSQNTSAFQNETTTMAEKPSCGTGAGT